MSIDKIIRRVQASDKKAAYCHHVLSGNHVHRGRSPRPSGAQPFTKEQAKSKAKGPYKRQISEAVPRAEREVGRVPEEAGKAVDDDLRKSARLRKPKSRN